MRATGRTSRRGPARRPARGWASPTGRRAARPAAAPPPARGRAAPGRPAPRAAPAPPKRGIGPPGGKTPPRPTSAPAYDAVRNDAYASWPAPNIADQNDNTDVMALAGGLIYQRTGDGALRAKVAQTVMAARGSEQGARALALGRNLVGYVLAADLINLHDYSPTDDQAFRSWLTAVRTEPMTGGPANLIDCHNSRPNNWGAHA